MLRLRWAVSRPRFTVSRPGNPGRAKLLITERGEAIKWHLLSRAAANKQSCRVGNEHQEAPASLTAAEEEFLRALARAMLAVPRAFDADLVREQRMSHSEYTALMHLSESPSRRLRMSDLAGTANLSLSGMSRIVDRLEGQGALCTASGAATMAAAGTPYSLTRDWSDCTKPGRRIWQASDGIYSPTSRPSTFPRSPRPCSASRHLLNRDDRTSRKSADQAELQVVVAE